MYITEDDNGNRQPVSEIRKRFENNAPSKTTASSNWSKDRSNPISSDVGKDIKRPLKLSKLESDDSAKLGLESDKTNGEKHPGKNPFHTSVSQQTVFLF